jgi:hypothetical protein
MFTPEERTLLRADLLEHAADDRRITGAAITGSASAEREDRLSDVDLAFGVRAAELPDVVSDWTSHMYQRCQAVHHLDIKFGAWLYRVFLLPGTLQVDLAFAPASEFRALGPTFRLVFGTAHEPRHSSPPAPVEIIGLAWLYALHARTCLARHKLWQAEYMISAVRDHALALACLRHDLPTLHGRGIDELPSEITAQFEGSLVRNLDFAELSRAFQVGVRGLLNEIRMSDEDLAKRLQEPLTQLTETTR